MKWSLGEVPLVFHFVYFNLCECVCVSGLSVSILFVQGSVPSSVTRAQTLSKQAIWELDCLQNRFHFHSQENMCALVRTHTNTHAHKQTRSDNYREAGECSSRVSAQLSLS